MTQSQWLSGIDPLAMLGFRLSHLTDRKIRLFACACCRCEAVQGWFRSRSTGLADVNLILSMVEKIADGEVHQSGLHVALERIQERANDQSPRSEYNGPYWLTYWAGQHNAATAAYHTVRRALAEQLLSPRWLADLLRHVIGDPFHPYPAPVTWSAVVVDLAQNLYDGIDTRLILHDALLDVGHPNLAEHFRVEEWHPKGCWVLDLVLGKK